MRGDVAEWAEARVVRVRRITMGDRLYPQECALREEILLGPIGFDMGRFRREFPGFEDRLEHFVATVDHPTGPRVVGVATLLPNDPQPGIGRVMQMAVDRQRQGEGIGRLLIVAIESRAFGELGIKELYCHTLEGSMGFFESLGWAADSERFIEAGRPHRRMVYRPEMTVAEVVDSADE